MLASYHIVAATPGAPAVRWGPESHAYRCEGAGARAMRTCRARLAMALSACHRCAAGRRPRTPRQNGFVPMATTTHRTAHPLCPTLATGRRRAERPIGFVPMATTTHRTAHPLCPTLATGRRRAERPIGRSVRRRRHLRRAAPSARLEALCSRWTSSTVRRATRASRPRPGAARGDLGVVAGRAQGRFAPAGRPTRSRPAPRSGARRSASGCWTCPACTPRRALASHAPSWPAKS
jgi:hypothetical protein